MSKDVRKEGNFTKPLVAGPSYAPANDGRRLYKSDQPRFLRFLANLFSFVFHPLFIPAYIAAFLLYIHPYVFSGFSEKHRMERFISVVLHTAFFPAFTVLLLKQLGFVKDIYLRTQRERIIPYIASMIYFFWIFYVSKTLPDSPPVFVILLLGVFISSIVALLANIYFKVSMHAIAMGAMLSFFILVAMQGSFSMGLYLSASILVAGLVCTARLIVSDHHPFEVYAGFFLGIISQALAIFFIR